MEIALCNLSEQGKLPIRPTMKMGRYETESRQDHMRRILIDPILSSIFQPHVKQPYVYMTINHRFWIFRLPNYTYLIHKQWFILLSSITIFL